MQYEICTGSTTDHPCASEALSLMKETNGSISEIVRRWFESRGRTLDIFPGINDETEEHEGITLGFSEGAGDPFFIFIPTEEVRSQFPHLRLVAELVVAESPEMELGNEEVDLDDSAFDAMLGVNRDESYDEVLGGSIYPFSTAIFYALAYALCPYGKATLCDIEPDLCDQSDKEGWKYANSALLQIEVFYQHQVSKTQKPVLGFGSWIYTEVPAVTVQ